MTVRILSALLLNGLASTAWAAKPNIVFVMADDMGWGQTGYPTYRAKGWQIGSGPVESACKTVIGERMKGGGIRWGRDGADAVSHVRALFCSCDRLWESLWSKI
jgi:hypothetical protein